MRQILSCFLIKLVDCSTQERETTLKDVLFFNSYLAFELPIISKVTLHNVVRVGCKMSKKYLPNAWVNSVEDKLFRPLVRNLLQFKNLYKLKLG